jgi:DNA-binding transcriptional MerR regulator
MDVQVEQPTGAQGELFAVTALGATAQPAGGYRGPTACQIVGITYRQLDYWARTGLVTPTLRDAHGSGNHRLYGFTDILVLKIVKRLLDAGVSLQNIRLAVAHLRAHGIHDLAQVTLLSDGITIYECRSPHEITDLLKGGQAVFGIALGAAIREITGTLRQFPTEAENLTHHLSSVPNPAPTPITSGQPRGIAG